MASIKDTAATSALNEEEYINKLYDTNLQEHNQLLKDNLDSGNAVLDEAQQQTQEKTDSYVARTEVEAGKTKNLYGTGGVTPGAQVQTQLSQENAQRQNVTALRTAQNDADMEFQRQRQLLASQYETEIRKAQADNDMERAQALYEAAKAEEAQLLELQKQGAQLLKKKGSNAGYNAIAAGQTLRQDTASESWEDVLQNEEALNQIYDAQLGSQRTQLDGQYVEAASDLEAQRLAREKQTDEALTQAYVDALRSRQAAAEARVASGQASGTAAQGTLAEDIALQNTLTELRKNQLAADADAAGQGFQLEKERGQAQNQAEYDINMARAKALFDAAEREEQTMIGIQELVGKQAAKGGDYSILAALYGLTPEQMKVFVPKPASAGYVPALPAAGDGAGNSKPETVGGGSLLPSGYTGISTPVGYNALLELLNEGVGSGFPNR